MTELLTFDACILQVNILFVDELFFDCSRETEEFMKAAYKHDDRPEKLSEQAINTCNALKARIKVRCSSNQLETKAPAAPEPASGGNMDFLKQWVQMAKELDGHSHAEVTRGSLHNSSSSQCLQSKPSNELLSLPCLDPAPVEPGSPLEQPDPIEKQKLLVEKTKSLADFEQEAFDRLQARQSGGKGKNKGKGKGKVDAPAATPPIIQQPSKLSSKLYFSLVTHKITATHLAKALYLKPLFTTHHISLACLAPLAF